MNNNKKEILYKKLVFILLLLIIFTFLLWYRQTELTNISLLPCAWKEIFDIYCPGCGLTRALHSILNFDFYQSFRYNNLVFPIVLVFVYFFLHDIVYYFTNKKLVPTLKIKTIHVVLATIILITYTVLRNTVPYFVPTTV